MRNVVLHGQAAELFGKEFRLDVNSLAEAVRALGAQIKGFRQFIIEHEFKLICKAKTAFHIEEDTLTFNLPKGADIHIVPFIQESKSGGIGKIVIGLAIAAVAFATAQPELFGFAAGPGLAGTVV